MHLSKPHHDAGSLVVNLVNPTAGIFDDDRISMDITVEEGASLVLTTPASNRVYRSRSGGDARVVQTLRVAEGAFLEYFPEPFIPHAGARYAQQNHLHVAKGARLMFFEWLAPGRVARGEVFQYEELCWDTDVWWGSDLVARERYAIRAEGESLSSLRLMSEAAHYLGCFIMGVMELPCEKLDALGGQDVYIGAAPLAAGGWSIKAVCRDALSARRTIKALRALIYKFMQRPPPALGRY